MVHESPKSVRVTRFEDPFNTSHITSNGTSTRYQRTPENLYENKEMMSRSANYGLIQVKPSTSSEFDQIATRMTVSSSSPDTVDFGTLTSMTSLTSTDSGIVSQSLLEDETDALSNLTLDETKLDKSFLAELEKNIYKQSSANVAANDSQMYANKEALTVNQISSILNHNQNNQISKNLNNSLQFSPSTKQKNINTLNKPQQQFGYKNYESTATFTNKQFSEHQGGAPSGPNIYGNYGTPTSTSTSTVANVYSSVAGDLYGSIAGDTYDEIHQQSPIYSNYGAIPRPKSNLNANVNSLSAIDLTNTSRELGISYNQQQHNQGPVIYDEVANDEMRPIRQAPRPPSMMGTLSHQQIQRRMEKQQAQVMALCQELGEDASEMEARLALEATNWDHIGAVRHFKVDRLFR